MASQILSNIINELGISPEDFSSSIGVGKSSVYKILRGDTKKISLSMAKKINKAFPQYSTIELLKNEKRTLNDTNEVYLLKDGVSIKDFEVIDWIVKNEKVLIDNSPYFKLWLNEKIKTGVGRELEKLGVTVKYNNPKQN
jgi:transcriptional regulator with XRE-family HTH domain